MTHYGSTLQRFGWLILLALCLIFSASTCEEPIDLPFEDPLQLVVVCEFTPNKAFEVVVSESKSILNSNTETVYRKDALVEIELNDQSTYRLKLQDDISNSVPFYSTEMEETPDIGEFYSLKVEVGDLPPVSASNIIPPPVVVAGEIGEIEIEQVRGEVYSYVADVIFKWEDDASIEDYYHLNIFRPITFFWVLDGDTLTNVVDPIGAEQIQESLNAEAPFQVNFNGGVLLKDETFNGQEISLPVKLQFELDRSEELFEFLYIELRAVSKEYYLFHSAVSKQQQDTRVTPVSEPFIVPTNIQGGLGLFAGYSINQDTLRTK